MVKPKDLTPTNPQQGQPVVGPVKLGPERPVDPVPTQSEQEQIIAQFEQETGQTFTPTKTAPKATLRQPAADTRSIRQQIQDVSQTLASRRAPMGDGAYIKKNGQWSFIERSKFLDGVAPGSMKFVYKGEERNFGAQGLEGGAILASTAAKIIANPFKVLGGPARKVKGAVENVDISSPYTDWLEDVVGSGVGGTAWLAQNLYDTTVKPTIRSATTFAMTPLQLVENLIFFGAASINYGTGLGRESYQPDTSIWDQAKGVLTNTTLAQTVIAGGDTGEGFFVDEETEAKRNKLEESLRPELYGQTATFGRVMAAPAVATGVVEAGDDLHSLISGSVDLAAQVFLDPLNKVAAPKALRTLGEIPSALASPRQQRALIKAGINLNPETLADAERILEQLGEAGKLSDQAEALVTQRPGVFWSGDRNAAERGEVISQFIDITDPGYVPNPENLLGEGLYISDSSPLASSYSSGRTGADEIITTPSSEIRVPELSEAPGESVVYEFRIPEKDFNIINAEEAWPTDPSLPYNLDNALEELGFSDNILKQIQDALAEKNIQALIKPPFEFPIAGETFADVRKFLNRPKAILGNAINPAISDVDQFVFDDRIGSYIDSLVKELDNEFSPSISTRRNNAQVFVNGELVTRSVSESSLIGSLKPNEINRELGKVSSILDGYLRSARSSSEEIVRQKELIDAITSDLDSTYPKLFQQTVIDAKQTSPLPLNKPLFEEGLFELKSLYKEVSRLYKDLIDQRIIDPEFLNDLLDVFALNGFGLRESVQVPLGDIGPWKNLKLTRTSNGGSRDYFGFEFDYKVDSLPWTHNRIEKGGSQGGVVNDWLASKGVDAMRYDGGMRIGGYGSHEAMAVLRPSKLDVVSARTGERLPTLEAKAKIAAGEELKVSAEDIAKARGYKDAAGFIEGARNGADNSRYRAWQSSGRGQNLIKALANDDDAYNIWLTYLKGKSPRIAKKLADAKTPEEIDRILTIATNSLDPYERLNALPGWSGNAISELGYRTKNRVSRNSRLAATLPQSNVLPLDDFTAGAKNLHDTMITFGVPVELRAEKMNEFLRIVSQDDYEKIRGDLFDFVVDAKQTIVQTKIGPLLEKLTEPLKKSFDEMTPFERLTMNRRIEVAEEIKQFARKTETLFDTAESITKYVIDDVGRMVPLAHIDGNGSGPLYLSQLNRTSPELFPADAQEFDKFYKLTESWAYYREVAKTLPGMGQTSKALETAMKYAFGAQTFWKKSVLFSGRYVARVVPEEMGRVALSGVFSGNEFSYVSEIIGGRLNKDIYGRLTPSIKEADSIVVELEQIEILRSRIEKATETGNTQLATKLQKKLSRFDENYENELNLRLAEIEDIIEGEGASVRDVMIGPKPETAANTVMGQNIPSYIRYGVQQVVSRSENSTMWLRGIAQEVIERAANPTASVTARAMLDGSPASLAYVAREMFEGTLRKPYETYFKALGKKKPGFNWDSIEGATTYVQQIRDDLMQITGGHSDLLKAISENKIVIGDEAVKLGRRTAEGNIPSEQFLNAMRTGDGLESTEPVFATWSKAPEMTTVYPSAGKFEQQKSEGAFAWFMQHAYGQASDKFARVPLWNRRRWNLIADMAPSLSKEEALKLSQNIGSYGIPDYIIENVADGLKRANGTGTLAEIDNLAGIQATEDVINLLFDARKRTLIGRNHRMLFPFFDAFREVGTQLVKTAINPIALHKVDKAQQGLKNLTIGGPGESQILGPGDVDGDGKDEGFVYKDPVTQRLVWNFPLVGAAARMLTGIPFDMKIDVGAMSMATTVIPSIGPYVALSYSAIPNRTGETWDRLNKLAIPFGMPNTEVQEYFTPLALRRIAQGAAAGTPFESVVYLFGDPNNDPVYKTMNNRVFQHEMASGRYPETEAGIREAMQISQDKTATLWWVRGMTQFFAPAAPISQFYAQTNSKLVPLGVFLEQVRATEQAVKDKGGTYTEQIDAVVGQFGDSVLPYLASISESSVPGAESSKEFYRFKTDNPKLFEKYPNIAGYLSPTTGEFDQEVYNMQRRSEELSVRDVEDLGDQVQQLWGNLRYNQAKNQIESAVGINPMSAFALSLAEQQLRASLPAWDRQLAYREFDNKTTNAVNDVLRLAEDKNFANYPVIAPLKEYLSVRSQIASMISRNSQLTGATSWRNNRGGIVEREALKMAGEYIVQQNPDFGPMWDNVLSKEFKTLTEQEKVLAQTGQLP